MIRDPTASAPRLVVSVTTVPWRIHHLEVALHSLLAQSFYDFDLNVYIPRRCLRGGERYDVPTALIDLEDLDPRVHLRRVLRDFGPATKLLGPFFDLQSNGLSAETLILTVDDDVRLERHAIEELVDAAARYPDAALGFMGISAEEFIHAETLAQEGLSSRTAGILGGYRGVLYPLRVLDPSLGADYAEVSRRCVPFLADDELISWNLGRRGITRRVVATRHAAPYFMLNLQLLNLPGPISHGDDNNAGVARARHCLREYYRDNGWDVPS